METITEDIVLEDHSRLAKLFADYISEINVSKQIREDHSIDTELSRAFEAIRKNPEQFFLDAYKKGQENIVGILKQLLISTLNSNKNVLESFIPNSDKLHFILSLKSNTANARLEIYDLANVFNEYLKGHFVSFICLSKENFDKRKSN